MTGIQSDTSGSSSAATSASASSPRQRLRATIPSPSAGKRSDATAGLKGDERVGSEQHLELGREAVGRVDPELAAETQDRLALLARGKLQEYLGRPGMRAQHVFELADDSRSARLGREVDDQGPVLEVRLRELHRDELDRVVARVEVDPAANEKGLIG